MHKDAILPNLNSVACCPRFKGRGGLKRILSYAVYLCGEEEEMSMFTCAHGTGAL